MRCQWGKAPSSLTVNQLADTNGDSFDAPEPSTLALFGAGLLSCLGLTWFRRHYVAIIGPLRNHVTGF